MRSHTKRVLCEHGVMALAAELQIHISSQLGLYYECRACFKIYMNAKYHEQSTSFFLPVVKLQVSSR